MSSLGQCTNVFHSHPHGQPCPSQRSAGSFIDDSRRQRSMVQSDTSYPSSRRVTPAVGCSCTDRAIMFDDFVTDVHDILTQHAPDPNTAKQWRNERSITPSLELERLGRLLRAHQASVSTRRTEHKFDINDDEDDDDTTMRSSLGGDATAGGGGGGGCTECDKHLWRIAQLKQELDYIRRQTEGEGGIGGGDKDSKRLRKTTDQLAQAHQKITRLEQDLAALGGSSNYLNDALEQGDELLREAEKSKKAKKEHKTKNKHKDEKKKKKKKDK